MSDKKIKIALATPCYTGQMDVEVAGRIGMYLYHLGKEHPEYEIEWFIVRRSFVHFSRNRIVDNAIALGFDYIWWVDDDCVLPANKDLDILHRLISHDKDIVITPYYMRRPPYCVGVLRSTDIMDPDKYYNLRSKDLKQGLIEVDGGGTHCMLTKVDLFRKMPRPYFALPEYGGTEDMYMCLKAKQMGAEIYCDSDIEVGHLGYAPIITSEDYKEFCEKRGGEPEPDPKILKELGEANGKRD